MWFYQTLVTFYFKAQITQTISLNYSGTRLYWQPDHIRVHVSILYNIFFRYLAYIYMRSNGIKHRYLFQIHNSTQNKHSFIPSSSLWLTSSSSLSMVEYSFKNTVCTVKTSKKSSNAQLAIRSCTILFKISHISIFTTLNNYSSAGF